MGGVCCRGNGLAVGRVKRIVVPSPGRDSAQMRPPCAFTIRLQIARPTPVPEYSPAVCNRLKGKKIVDAYF